MFLTVDAGRIGSFGESTTAYAYAANLAPNATDPHGLCIIPKSVKNFFKGLMGGGAARQRNQGQHLQAHQPAQHAPEPVPMDSDFSESRGPATTVYHNGDLTTEGLTQCSAIYASNENGRAMYHAPGGRMASDGQALKDFLALAPTILIIAHGPDASSDTGRSITRNQSSVKLLAADVIGRNGHAYEIVAPKSGKFEVDANGNILDPNNEGIGALRELVFQNGELVPQ